MTSISVSARRPVAMPSLPVGMVAGWLAVAAAAELLILRTFTRTAIHIPALEQLSGPYTVVSDAGRYAYYLAATLLVIALPVMAAALWQAGPAGRLGALAIGEFAVAAAAVRLGASQEALLAFAMVVAVVTAAAAAGVANRRLLPLSGAFALAFAMAAGQAGLQSETAYNLGLPNPKWLLDAAEVVAVLAAATAPFALTAGRGRRRLAAAGVAGAITFVLLVGSGPTTRILMLWNEGLSGTLPAIVYAIAVAALAWGAAGSWASGRRLQAVAVVLLVAGGIGLHSTYQTGLVMIALTLLVLPARPALARAAALQA